LDVNIKYGEAIPLQAWTDP